jgi:hypothetical protein
MSTGHERSEAARLEVGLRPRPLVVAEHDEPDAAACRVARYS